jgi:hypothetical protein
MMEINEKNKYNTKDIAKYIREQLKLKFKDLKFSVTKESYSGGSSIHLTLLESKKIRFVKKPEEIDENEIRRLMCARNDTEEEIKKMIETRQKSSKLQVNQYHLKTDWQFTEQGKEILQQILNIANKYNWDNSNAMIDYFDVNYYLHFNLGRYDKPFIDGLNS